MGVLRLEWSNVSKVGPFWFLQLPLCGVYGPILKRALPSLLTLPFVPGTKTRCATKLSPQAKTDLEQLEALLTFLKETLLVTKPVALTSFGDNELVELYALGRNHIEPGSNDYTEVGADFYRAKYQRNEGASTALVRKMATAIHAHPTLARIDWIASVPPNPGKDFHLPDRIVTALPHEGISTPRLVMSKASTPQIKELPLQQKSEALVNAFQVPSRVAGKSVLIIDDICQSGSTLFALAHALRGAGAASVFGLVAVKAWRDSDNLPR